MNPQEIDRILAQGPLFKILDLDMQSCNGGTLQWKLGKWYKVRGKLRICKKGLHLTKNPDEWFNRHKNRLFVVEAKGVEEWHGDKCVCHEVRLIAEVSQPLWDEYEKKKQPLWDEYRKKKQPLLDEYEKKNQPLWDEYEKKYQPLLDEYRKKNQPLWDEYEKKYQPLWDEYRKKNQTLWDNLARTALESL